MRWFICIIIIFRWLVGFLLLRGLRLFLVFRCLRICGRMGSGVGIMSCLGLCCMLLLWWGMWVVGWVLWIIIRLWLRCISGWGVRRWIVFILWIIFILVLRGWMWLFRCLFRWCWGILMGWWWWSFIWGIWCWMCLIKGVGICKYGVW